MDLKEKANSLPKKPGVYLMKDSIGSIIYVGKSKKLKNRVSSYFQKNKSHSPKVEKMIKSIKDFDHIVTDTELEAFLLECSLIKSLKPMFNKLMKSNEGYLFIEITVNEPYPDILISYEKKSDKSLYFGPYTKESRVENAIEGIRESVKILCSSKVSWKKSECLNYSLGLCMGICKGEEVRNQYVEAINKVIRLLQDNDDTILKDLKHKMIKSSEDFDFRKASKYRDYINDINSLLNKHNVIEHIRKNKNIAAVEYVEKGTFKLFLIKGSKVLNIEKFTTDMNHFDDIKSKIRDKIISVFVDTKKEKNSEVSKKEIDEAQIIFSYLKNKNNNCRYIVVPRTWLSLKNKIKMDEAINKLIKDS